MMLLLLLLLPVAFVLVFLFKPVHSTLWIPWRVQKHFQRQGITGPGYRPIAGNSAEFRRLFKEAQSKSIPFHHDILQHAAPYYHRWSRIYGKDFFYWFGSKPRLLLSDPDMVKEVLMNTSGLYEKNTFNPLTKTLFGQGLPGLIGEKWALHRRIATQAFTVERVKVMI